MKYFRFVLFAIYLMAVVFLCFGHFSFDEDVPKSLFNLPADKIVHFCMFFPFPALCTFALCRRNVWRSLALAVIASVADATAIELLQSILTDYRTTDILDLVANMSGIVTGALLSVLFLLVRGK